MADKIESMDAFAAYILKTAGSNEDVKLETLYADGPCILYFMRRFGCQICRWQAKQLNTLCPEFKEKKHGRVAAIGPEALGVEEFANFRVIDADFYYDPEKKLYNDLHMKRSGMISLFGTFLKRATWDSISKSKQEGIGGNLKGDVNQLGGLIAVDKGGKVLYQFRQNDFSEHVNLEELAKALGIDYKAPPEHEPAPAMCASGSCAPVHQDGVQQAQEVKQ